MKPAFFASAVCEFIFSQGTQWHQSAHEPKSAEARLAYEVFHKAICAALRWSYHSDLARRKREREEVAHGLCVISDIKQYQHWLEWQGIDPRWAQELVIRQFRRWYAGMYAHVHGFQLFESRPAPGVCGCGQLLKAPDATVCQRCHGRALAAAKAESQHVHVLVGGHECNWAADGMTA